MRSRPMSVSALSAKTSDARFTSPLSTSCSTSFSPRPSTSSAPRLARCSTLFLSCAGQSRFGQRVTASPSSRTVAEPQTGHLPGRWNGRVRAGRFFFTTSTTWGITSPARCTTTVSPTRTSLRSTSSWLWSEAFETVTPPTCTGRSFATGVSAPVRPTWTSMASITVVACCGGNLNAIAQRGERGSSPDLPLQVEPVDLEDRAVHLDRQRLALLEHALVIRQGRLQVGAGLALGTHREAPGGQLLQHLHLPLHRSGQTLGHGVGPELEGAEAAPVDIVELTQRAGRRVARVGEGLLAAFEARRVEAAEGERAEAPPRRAR